ncbi:hypothetical protein BDY17DRAFT_128528 [Neohortaea acidophila]|uniref:Uncharacterized protein n=1 Tax=Neohortaea acidophila TaxID=245834 RepID=A0A6A6PY88_9PEZI|nr:uncharacterized protein BDY17DRAFT_128528 [Neohortaea acidophila]KAF2484443.1 hypothetical protein BDY17DRAFT_128528 [Neohortaea acidophila]
MCCQYEFQPLPGEVTLQHPRRSTVPDPVHTRPTPQTGVTVHVFDVANGEPRIPPTLIPPSLSGVLPLLCHPLSLVTAFPEAQSSTHARFRVLLLLLLLQVLPFLPHTRVRASPSSHLQAPPSTPQPPKDSRRPHEPTWPSSAQCIHAARSDGSRQPSVPSRIPPRQLPHHLDCRYPQRAPPPRPTAPASASTRTLHLWNLWHALAAITDESGPFAVRWNCSRRRKESASLTSWSPWSSHVLFSGRRWVGLKRSLRAAFDMQPLVTP